MNANRDFVLIGIGELLWDCFTEERRPGGAPANVAFHAKQLGMKSVVASRVGCDNLGDELRAFLHTSGLDTSHIQTDSEHPTGTVTVKMARPDHPEYTIHENVAWDHIEFDKALEQTCGYADAICFGTLAQRSKSTRQTIRKAVEAASSALIVYDVNLRAPFFDRETIETSLEACHVAKFNDQEAAILADLLELADGNSMPRTKHASGDLHESGDDHASGALHASAALETFAATLQDKYHLDAVCVTRGADGCLIHTPTDSPKVAAKPITVIDTVGAGDAFTAAITYAFLNHWPAKSAGNFANKFAAQVAARPGAMPTLDSAVLKTLLP